MRAREHRHARGVRSHTGSVHGAALFGVAATAAEAAIIGVLAERLPPDGEGRSARSAVADADITFWRAVRDTVVAAAAIEDLPGDEVVTADLLIARRNVSVTVDLADATCRAIGRAGFHWVVLAGCASTGEDDPQSVVASQWRGGRPELTDWQRPALEEDPCRPTH